MKKIYEYETETVENIPDGVPIEKAETVQSEREWYGHSLGDAVGRIYEDGEKVSFFVKDKENGNTELFDRLLTADVLRERRRKLISIADQECRECREYYVMRKVTGHSSQLPTVTDKCLDTPCNVDYEYRYEILLVADEEYRRSVVRTVHTDGPYTYSLYDEMRNLEQLFEEWADEKEYGFGYEDGQPGTLFYNDFGEELFIPFDSMNHLLMAINSIRITELKRRIRERGE